MLYFSIAMFFYVNLENFLYWWPILQDNFIQLISTVKKSYYHCATINIAILLLNVHRRLDRLVLLNLIHDVIIAFLFFIRFWLHLNWCCRQMKEHVIIITNLTLWDFCVYWNQFSIAKYIQCQSITIRHFDFSQQF